eukprot:178167-Chlamydomonas_euryale.AAC.2
MEQGVGGSMCGGHTSEPSMGLVCRFSWFLPPLLLYPKSLHSLSKLSQLSVHDALCPVLSARGSGLRARSSGLSARCSGLQAQGPRFGTRVLVLGALGFGLRAHGSELRARGPGLKA